MPTQHTASITHRRLPAGAALLALVLFAVSANIVVASLVRVSAEFGLDPRTLANVSAVQFGGFLIASVVGGILADRIGKKPVLQGAALLVAAGAALWGIAGHVPTLFAGALIMGLGGGVIESMCSALLTDLFPDRRKFYLNMSQVAYCLGAIGGPALMGRLLPAGYSWRVFYWGTSLLALLVGGLFTLSHIPFRRASTPTRPSPLAGDCRRPRLPLHTLLPCAAIFLYVFAEMGVLTFMAVYLQRVLQAPESWSLYAIGIFWGGMVLGRLGCAFLPEEHSYELAIGTLTLAGSVFVFCQIFIDNWRLSILCFGLNGLAYAGIWPLIVGLAASTHSTATSGRVIGLTVASGALGCVAAPPVLGLLFKTVSADAMFAVVVAILLLTAGLMAPGIVRRRSFPQGILPARPKTDTR